MYFWWICYQRIGNLIIKIKWNLENLRYINVYIVSIIYCCALKIEMNWKFEAVTFVNLFRKFNNGKLEIWKLMIPMLAPIFDIILICWEISVVVIPFFEINFQRKSLTTTNIRILFLIPFFILSSVFICIKYWN